MGNTSLHESQPQLSAQMTSGKYLGVEAPAHFGDPAAELAALRAGCGVFQLSWRAKVAITGKDRVRWLHNMVTNNVRDLTPNRGNYNFILNAQGRILGDMYIYNLGESLMLDTDSMQVEPLLAAMKRYIIMDKVEMNLEPLFSFGICGPQAQEKLAASGVEVGGMEPLEIREHGNGAKIARGPSTKPGWYELWAPIPDDASGVAFVPGWAGSHPVGMQALEWWRILQGIPQYGQDTRDRDLPQETGQVQALNFTKGCYIGQEIVERIRSRGQVHRKFTGFEFEGEPPAPGKFDVEGRTVAEITSVASIPSDAGVRNIGLGYVRREVAEAGSQVDLNGRKAKIVDLPFAG